MKLRRTLTLLLTTSLLVATTPARADWLGEHLSSPLGPADGEAPTAKKVVSVALLVGTAAAFATSFVFLAQANSAESDRKDILRESGGLTEGLGAQCKTAEQCARLEDARTDRDDAKASWEGAMLTGSVLAIATLGTMMLWPNVAKEKTTSLQVAPRAGQTGGGLVVVGSF